MQITIHTLCHLALRSSIAICISHCVGCSDWDSNDASNNGTEKCALFDVTETGQNNREICTCVPNGTNAATFLDEVCEDEVSAEIGGAASCAIDGSVYNNDDPAGSCDPDESNLPEATGPVVETGGEECTHYTIDGACCNPDVETDCCDAPGGQVCVGYHFGNYAHTAPGPNPPFTEKVSNGSITLTVHVGTGSENSDNGSIEATASYGFADCGESVCPFYLAAIDWESTANLDVIVNYMAQTKTKTVEDLRSSLLFPVLGKWNTSSNVVTFDAGRIVYSTKFTISGAEFDDENGSYWKIIRNDNAVTGTVNTSTKLVEWNNMSFDLSGLPSQVTASLDFGGTESLDGEPPVADGDVSSVTCEEPNKGTVELDGTSTDPDGDLEYEVWRIGGTLVHVGSGPETIALPNGTHLYEIRAIDERGAFDHASGPIVVSCN